MRTPVVRFLALATSAAGLLSASPGAAQQPETLLGRDFESGGFGGPTVQVMDMGDDVAVFVGGRGGWIINHVLSIGGGGWGLTNKVATSVTDTAGGDTRLNVGYGGVILEYTLRPYELVHYSASLLAGWGSAGYGSLEAPDASDTFFVLEPAAGAELNVTEFFRLVLGVSWRFTQGLELEGFTDEDMSQAAGVVTFKFGSF